MVAFGRLETWSRYGVPAETLANGKQMPSFNRPFTAHCHKHIFAFSRLKIVRVRRFLLLLMPRVKTERRASRQKEMTALIRGEFLTSEG